MAAANRTRTRFGIGKPGMIDPITVWLKAGVSLK